MEKPNLYYVKEQNLKEFLYNQIESCVKETVISSITQGKGELQLINKNRKASYINELVFKLENENDLYLKNSFSSDFCLEENKLKIHPDSIIDTIELYNEANSNKKIFITLLDSFDFAYNLELCKPIELKNEVDLDKIFKRYFSDIFNIISDLIILKFWKNEIKIIELINKESETKEDNSYLKWYGKQTELIELTKALIENGNLKAKQEDVFTAIQNAFNIELNNIDQAITKFNSRNQENETKFLDTLKDSLSKYIKTKIEKNH